MTAAKILSQNFDFKKDTDPENLLEKLFGKKDSLSGYQFSPQMPAASKEIPKIIHQIWLGSPLPSRLEKMRKTWMNHHPSWQFRLWTDRDLGAFDCKDLIDSTDCFGQKSDLLRAEILYWHGGLYVDLDIECFQPMDAWIQDRSFLAGLRWILQAHLGWPSVWQEPLVICNSLFGAGAGHPLLANYLELSRQRWKDRALLDLKENELDRISLAVMGGAKKASHAKETGLRTYLPFHEVVHAARSEVSIFPPSFFNPKLPQWAALYMMPQFWQAQKKSQTSVPQLWKYSGIKDHSIACHWSKASWLS